MSSGPGQQAGEIAVPTTFGAAACGPARAIGVLAERLLYVSEQAGRRRQAEADICGKSPPAHVAGLRVTAALTL